MAEVRIKKTVTVNSRRIESITAKLEDGTDVVLEGPAAVGDYHITDQAGNQEVLSAADYAAALVTSS